MSSRVADPEVFRRPILEWYADNARSLPWRAPDASAWAVLVSEVMLQQTPVARVLPVWTAWLERWPTATALAAEEPAAAIRAWGRLGYPRRALRLHAAARAIRERFDGEVPPDEAELRELPGIGEYTAAAVTAFAFGRRSVVLDTNVRRVLGRIRRGQSLPAPAVAKIERTDAATLLPPSGAAAARWSVAVMELGALVCTARAPACEACPVSADCRWFLAGRPENGPRRTGQTWEGTDRQARGRLLAVLRATNGAVGSDALDPAWPPTEQRERALASLLADGLLVRDGARYRLP